MKGSISCRPTSCRIVMVALLILAGCAHTGPPPRVRSLDADGPHRYHRPVTLQVGWQSYVEQDSAAAQADPWSAPIDSVTTGVTPVLILHYLDDAERIALPMGIDDALLGRIIKSTAMSEMPVKEPLTRYLERVDCMHCHPTTIPLE